MFKTSAYLTRIFNNIYISVFALTAALFLAKQLYGSNMLHITYIYAIIYLIYASGATMSISYFRSDFRSIYKFTAKRQRIVGPTTFRISASIFLCMCVFILYIEVFHGDLHNAIHTFMSEPGAHRLREIILFYMATIVTPLVIASLVADALLAKRSNLRQMKAIIVGHRSETCA